VSVAVVTYSATKAAVNAFHESLRQEVRTQGVRVSVVEVDNVATGFGDRRAAVALNMVRVQPAIEEPTTE